LEAQLGKTLFARHQRFNFRNTFKDIARILKDLGEQHGTHIELECYDVGHLYNLTHFVDKGAIKPQFFVRI
jgi:uncharacterized protein (DUF849 family)